MNNQFKKGDRVICIQTDTLTPEIYKLRKGVIYTVEYVTPGRNEYGRRTLPRIIRLLEIQENWYVEWFRPARNNKGAQPKYYLK